MIEHNGDLVRMFVTEADTLEIYGFDGTGVAFCLHSEEEYNLRNPLVSSGCAEPEDWHESTPKHELSKEEMTELFKVIRDWIKERELYEM